MSTGIVSEAGILSAVNRVEDPVFRRTLGELRVVEKVESVSPDGLRVVINLPVHCYPQKTELVERIEKAIRQSVSGIREIAVDLQVKVKGKESGGALGLRVKNVIAVGSGKGGVGKSTVAASLAYGLMRQGAKVGLMDADVYGPSIPHMLSAHGQPALTEMTGTDGKPVRRIQPIEAQGLKVMSMGFFVPAEEAVVWRGPMLHGAITQFLRDTEWGELDYLIIDLPPGTGDVSLTLSQLLGLAGAVVVCTPQKVALLDAVKAIAMFRKVKIPVLGIVENMTGEVFGHGGAARTAQEMGIPFLGEIPMNPALRVNADEGQLQENYSEENPSRVSLEKIAEATAIRIVHELLSGPALPTLEVL